jgi:hypothetical protein
VEFIHLKLFAQTDRIARVRGDLDGASVDMLVPVSTIVQRLAMSHGLNFAFVNVSLRREVVLPGRAIPAFVFVVRTGAGPTLPHAESTIGGVAQEQYEGGGGALQAGGSIETSISKHVIVLADYKFTWTEPEIRVAAGGTATIPSRSHYFVAGLGFRL